MPTSRDKAIFFAHDDNNNDTTDYFTPCACARGNNYYGITNKTSWAVALPRAQTGGWADIPAIDIIVYY